MKSSVNKQNSAHIKNDDAPSYSNKTLKTHNKFPTPRIHTFGKLKSDGTLCRQVIWGLSGNLSKMRKRKGNVSLISALCSRNLSCFSFLISSSSSKLSRMTATNKLRTIWNTFCFINTSLITETQSVNTSGKQDRFLLPNQPVGLQEAVSHYSSFPNGCQDFTVPF